MESSRLDLEQKNASSWLAVNESMRLVEMLRERKSNRILSLLADEISLSLKAPSP